MAVKSVKAALDYNIAKQKRIRYLREEQHEHEKGQPVPSLEDLAALKLTLEHYTDLFRKERNANLDEDGNAERDEILQVVQDQLLDLSDKFDSYLISQITTGELGSLKKSEIMQRSISVNSQR